MNVHPCLWLEITVMLFQVGGLVTLCLSRTLRSSRWAERARLLFLVALVGLGLAGALLSQFDSEFALFAGATITLLLIGMTWGTDREAPIVPGSPSLKAQATAASSF
jgi:hypothetical protein